MIARVMLLLVALVSTGAQAQEIKESDAFAVLGELSMLSISKASIMWILPRQKVAK